MGFAISGPGTFYASGHPAEGVDLPAPVGLSRSGTRTWAGPARPNGGAVMARLYTSLGVRREYDHLLKRVRATAEAACVPGRVRRGT